MKARVLQHGSPGQATGSIRIFWRHLEMMANTQRILAAARRLSARGPFRALSGSPAPITRCAFIGLGNMGAPMAHNFVSPASTSPSRRARRRAGAPRARRRRRTRGAERGRGGRGRRGRDDRTGRAAEEVYLGPSGLLASAPPARCSSTARPTPAARAASRRRRRRSAASSRRARLRRHGRRRGRHAHVHRRRRRRGRARARARGCSRAWARASARRWRRGQVAKICNNLLLGIMMAGTSERSGSAPRTASRPSALAHHARVSGNWVLQKYNPAPGVMESAPRRAATRAASPSSMPRTSDSRRAPRPAPATARRAIPLGTATGALSRRITPAAALAGLSSSSSRRRRAVAARGRLEKKGGGGVCARRGADFGTESGIVGRDRWRQRSHSRHIVWVRTLHTRPSTNCSAISAVDRPASRALQELIWRLIGDGPP